MAEELKYWALIKNKVIVNIAVGDDAWADSVRADYDAIVEVTKEAGQPSIGWEEDDNRELKRPADDGRGSK